MNPTEEYSHLFTGELSTVPGLVRSDKNEDGIKLLAKHRRLDLYRIIGS